MIIKFLRWWYFVSIPLFTVEAIETLLSLTSRKFIDNLPVDNKFKMKFQASASRDLLYPCRIELCHTLFKGFPFFSSFYVSSDTDIDIQPEQHNQPGAPQDIFSPLLFFLFFFKVFNKTDEKASSNSSTSSSHRVIVLCCVFMGDYSVHFPIKGKILAQESFCCESIKAEASAVK